MNPEEILASGDVLEKIDTIIRRHFDAENERDECYVFVLDRLKSDNFKRLRVFKGQSKLSTYLHTLVNSLVIDFRRQRYGRRRVPALVLKLGKWAEAVYRLVCWQKFSFDDAFDFLQIDGLYPHSYKRFRQEIVPIQNAPCRENPGFQSIDDASGGPLQNLAHSGLNPLETLLKKLDRTRRIRAIEIIRETTEKLPENDQLLVRLVFGSGHSAAAAAKIIELSASTARKKLKRLLITYRAKLLAAGIREP